MSVEAIAPIERAVHTTKAWPEELRQELRLVDRQQAYHVLRAVPRALRDRLTVAETIDLGAQLPMLVRGQYFEGWTPVDKPLRERKREGFLGHIGALLGESPRIDPEGVARGVFRVLEKHVSAGEIEDIKSILPAEIHAL
jgi:uncharacterized protein (DUF2267 family)